MFVVIAYVAMLKGESCCFFMFSSKECSFVSILNYDFAHIFQLIKAIYADYVHIMLHNNCYAFTLTNTCNRNTR